MIDKNTLRELTLETFSVSQKTQFENLKISVKKKSQQRDLNFDGTDEDNLQEIIWDLISERIITLGSNAMNPNWPHLRLTDFGSETIQSDFPSYHNPTTYLNTVTRGCPGIDSSIIQYIEEGLKCFKSNLMFGTAVMFGAAAEKLVLLLLEILFNSESDPKLIKKGKDLYDQPRLPSIFEYIEKRIKRDIDSKTLPYPVHQGLSTHLNSAFEMIRIQRNEAVHPKFSQVSKQKVFLTIQTFPTIAESVYKLLEHYAAFQSQETSK